MPIPYWKRKKLDYYLNQNQNEPPSSRQVLTNSNLKNPRVEFSKNISKPPKKLNDLDKYLIFAFASLLLFTIAVLIIFAITGTEPQTLVACFFAAFGGEILMCALIKRLKLHKEAEIKKEDTYGT